MRMIAWTACVLATACGVACGDASSPLPGGANMWSGGDAGAGGGASGSGSGGTGGTEPGVDAGGSSATEAGGGAVGPEGGGAPSSEAGGPSTPDAGGGAASCGSLPLCDGFESDAPGAPPAGWTVVMGCNPNTQDTAAPGGGLLVGVDASQHHGGSHALRVVGGDSCGYYAVNTAAFAGHGPQVYARLWVLFSGSPTPNHNGFLSMATQGGDHLRLGFQDQVIDWNAQTSDATLPDMDPQGTTLSAATQPMTWSCLEFHIDETSGHLEFWKDGQAVPGLGWDGTTTQGVNDQWSRGGPNPAVPTSLGLGWLGLNEQQTAWFDDVAVGSARIGCN